jgi:hypothetical protein
MRLYLNLTPQLMLDLGLFELALKKNFQSYDLVTLFP